MAQTANEIAQKELHEKRHLEIENVIDGINCIRTAFGASDFKISIFSPSRYQFSKQNIGKVLRNVCYVRLCIKSHICLSDSFIKKKLSINIS